MLQQHHYKGEQLDPSLSPLVSYPYIYSQYITYYTYTDMPLPHITIAYSYYKPALIEYVCLGSSEGYGSGRGLSTGYI